MPAGKRNDLMTSFSVGKAQARMEQLWSTVSVRCLSCVSTQRVSVLAGKALFIPPKTWKRLYLPYTIHLGGGTAVALSLQKDGLIVGLSLTKVQLRVNAYKRRMRLYMINCGIMIHRGYFMDVSIAEDVYFNPLLPVRKSKGTLRFINDFRRLNTHFPRTSETLQVALWRKIWELNPKWKY